MRHLQGISLRNLSLSRPADQIRGKTNDDGSLPYALKSPTKLLAQHENRKLEHSRSSIELKSPPKQHEMRHDETQPFEASESRPLPDKLRRRSTLNWTNALPRVRQKKLEDVTGSRMANTWFSLYCSDSSEPVYISEVIEKAMNPNFRFFDLNVYGPSVTRRDDFTLKFWVRTEGRDEYTLLIQAQICLSSLQFIGKTVGTSILKLLILGAKLIGQSAGNLPSSSLAQLHLVSFIRRHLHNSYGHSFPWPSIFQYQSF